MDIDNGTDTVTITLTRAEANSLRVDLMDLDPSRVCSRTMIQGLIEGLNPVVSRDAAADAIKAVATDLVTNALKYDDAVAGSYLCDAGNLLKIADCVRQNDLRVALVYTENLDTAVRDLIPKCAHPYVGLRSL